MLYPMHNYNLIKQIDVCDILIKSFSGITNFYLKYKL